MVYSHNIAAGEGYVYNIGGERVEGSTSPAWTALVALSFLVSDEPYRLLLAISVLLTSVALYFPTRFAAELGGRIGGALTLLTVLACPTFFGWCSTTLMDTGLWAAALSSAIYSAVSTQAKFTPLIPCLILLVTRPESWLLAPAILVTRAIRDGAEQPHRHAIKVLAVRLSLCAAWAVGLVGIRIAYFGQPLPNTYYAKVGSDRLHAAIDGLKQAARFALDYPLIGACMALLLIPTTLAVVRIRSRPLRESAGPLLTSTVTLMPMLGFVAVMASSRDHFVGHRIIQPFLPWMLPFAALAVQSSGLSTRVRRVALPLAGLGVFLVVPQVITASRQVIALRDDFTIAVGGRNLGEFFSKHFGPTDLPSIGVLAAGGLKATYPGTVYDLLGLNWVAMARASNDRRGYRGHAAFDAETFWGAGVDLVCPNEIDIAPRTAGDTYDNFTAMVLKGILTTQRFRDEYRAVSLARGGRWITLFAHKSLLSALESKGWLALPWERGF